MHVAEHEKRCTEMLGEPFAEVHQFLEQFFIKYNMSPIHRMLLHHRLGVAVVGLEFGSDAKEAARIHIRDDLGGVLPTGPEWFLTQNNYLPSSVQEDFLEADMRALLGYVPDFNVNWVVSENSILLKCQCGYQGPPPNGFKECPWCKVPKTERFANLVQMLRR